ncbi:MAG: ferritin family protein [Sarcina sp.]
MSYTTSKQPQGKARILANFLREAMIGELVGINTYQEHLSCCPIHEIKEIIEHIMLDEKRHFGMLLDLSRKCDCVQFEKAVEVSDHLSVKCKTLNEHSDKKKINSASLLNKIREDIKGELEAIIAYEDIIFKIDDKDAIKMIEEIVADEKEHVEELTYMLQRLDGHCYGPLEKGF